MAKRQKAQQQQQQKQQYQQHTWVQVLLFAPAPATPAAVFRLEPKKPWNLQVELKLDPTCCTWTKNRTRHACWSAL
eukprot:3991499-Prymnesium_polylepis.1